jgi:molybdopterin converting factor small subunit
LNIPSDQIKLVFLNGEHVDPDAVLKEGSRLGVFPPVGGG